MKMRSAKVKPYNDELLPAKKLNHSKTHDRRNMDKTFNVNRCFRSQTCEKIGLSDDVDPSTSQLTQFAQSPWSVANFTVYFGFVVACFVTGARFFSMTLLPINEVLLKPRNTSFDN